ncbi:AAA family ATPase, partial [Halapricum sp. CBA1109]|nr:AAA family ATPase [Halapricum sp. CBA1109]
MSIRSTTSSKRSSTGRVWRTTSVSSPSTAARTAIRSSSESNCNPSCISRRSASKFLRIRGVYTDVSEASVITVGGAKGGAGKTVTAINVAAALKSTGFSVAVVDADLGTTNVADILSLDCPTSIHQVLAGDAAVEDAIVTHDSGLDVVSGGDSIEYLTEADPAQLRPVVETLRTEYDIVVVDTGTGLSHEVLVPFGLADGVVLV